MTLKSPAFLREYVRVHHQVVSHAEACRRLGGIDQSTVFIWLRKSKEAAERKDYPSEWLVEVDGETKYFHEYCARAFSDCYQTGVANAFVRFRDGVKTTLTYQGHVCYKINPDWLDEGMRFILGLGEGDKYLRDKDGNMIPETIVQPPSTDLALALMAAHQPKIYGKRSTVDVNQNVSGGVMVVGGPKQPAQIAAPLPMLQEVVQEAEQEPERVPSDDPDLSVSDTDPAEPQDAPVDDDDDDIVPATAELNTGPRIAEPTPSQYQPARNPLIDPARADALREKFLATLPTDNAAVRAALKGIKA